MRDLVLHHSASWRTEPARENETGARGAGEVGRGIGCRGATARALAIAWIAVLTACDLGGRGAAQIESEPGPAPHAESEALQEPNAEPERSGTHGPWTIELRLESAPFAEPRAPSVVVHAPPELDPERPLRLVVFLHGWSGCARVLAGEGPIACRDGERARDGWALASRVDLADTDALFVVPQLAFLERSGDPGRFVEPGRFRAFVEEMLAALPLGDASLARVESITLLAHSAGFETALALIAHGGLPIHSIVLFDALYRGVEPFTAWVSAAPERRLISLYTGDARTARQSHRLAAHARAVLGEDAVAYEDARALPELVRSHRVVIARSPAPHGSVPARHIAELLPSLGASARP